MISKTPPQINASSMADIAFLLLVFFLVTTTVQSEIGIARILPPHEESPTPPNPRHQRNVLELSINSNDQLMADGEYIDITALKDLAKEFIANPMNKENLPAKKQAQVAFFGNVMVSKQVISVRNDNQTSYNAYVQVQNEIVAAYNELRNELAKQKFNYTYQELIDLNQVEKAKAIKAIYPMRISEAEPYAQAMN